jgi:hypothetical protein
MPSKVYNQLFIACILFTTLQCGNSNNMANIKPKATKLKDISNAHNTLSGNVETIEAHYIVFGCAGPNWITHTDYINNNCSKKFKELYFYIEPADSTLALPATFDAYKHRVILQGQFYKNADYAKGTIEGEELMPKAKVFRYTQLQIVENFKK